MGIELGSFYQGVREFVDGLRRDKSVVGVWQRPEMQREGGVSELIVVERENQTAEKVVLGQDGSEVRISGKVFSRRFQTGHPERRLFFVSDDGADKVLLESHEF